MRLCELLKGVDYEVFLGEENIHINNINYNSKEISEGDVFFCIKGLKTDGHKYARAALEKGAVAIIVEDDIEELLNCTVIKVEDSRKALSLASANYYGNPSKKLKIIGITGTNGKTTSTYILKSILEEAGYKVGLVGTIANYIGKDRYESERTTPESLELQKLFNEMVEKKVDYCVMEVSSHSLILDRVYGIEFDYGIFTNLTQDHLDFHKTFENYFNAKLKLFENSGNIIVNIDDIYGKKIEAYISSKLSEKKIFNFSIEEASEFRAKEISINEKGIKFSIIYNDEKLSFDMPIPGKYNVYNALGCIKVALNEGIGKEVIQAAINKVIVPGRCEIIGNDKITVIIDYAHTPDGLSNILNTVKEFTKGRLICVFGCGGDRDATKRPIMGKIATEISDLCIITSDNPRTEEPMNIIKDIVNGLYKENYIIIENRREAIDKAIAMAQQNDIIVIAGKGHETYQILKDKTIEFDEKKIVQEILRTN